MLTFTQFCTLSKRKQLVLESVYNKVIKESNRFRHEFESKFYSGQRLVFEDVQSLVQDDLNQTNQDKAAMDQFVQEYKALSSQEKIELVDKLSKPIGDSKYIENNNEVKLILIYKTEPNSPAGDKAFEYIILNKQKWFEVIAGKAAASGKIPANQAADYAQHMVLTLLGGGQYNEKNGKKFSLDAYDPYSGVPFNSFVNTYIVNSAGNKFSATFNNSISTDYNGAKMNVVSIDTPTNTDGEDKQGELIDTIPDSSSTGGSPDLSLSDTEQKQLLEKFLKNPKMNDKEREAIKLRYGIGTQNGEEVTLLDIGLKLGYPKTSAIQNARRIVNSAQSKLKQFASQNFKK